MVPESNDKCLYGNRRGEKTQGTDKPWEDGGRHWSTVVTSQGSLEPPGAGRDGKDSLLDPLEEIQSC